MSLPSSPTTSADSEEIVSSRFFATQREQLFDAFKDPTRLASWWGPEGFTNTIEWFDLRPGGQWRFTMHGPDGTDYAQVKTFTLVDEPSLVVFEHHQPVHSFTMTLAFDVEGSGTRLTWRMVFSSAEEGRRVRDFILQANEQNFDRLEAHLADLGDA